MNSAPIETVEISDAELDNVAGGLHPQAGLEVCADAGAYVGAAGTDVVAAAGAYGHVGVNASV
ncbi:hypothetical protein NGM37_39360 [Streptomyces sp. TRM76130]|nr:hypothetical protein [Streptomyces sp. TRM76130]